MNKELIVDRNGRSFVLYAGLLDLAHQRGLKSITTTLIQIPSDLNGLLAICHATVETEQGTFTGLGDAGPDNVSRMMVPHLIRMAETRAKARALRDAVNVGVTAVEELADLDDAAGLEHGTSNMGGVASTGSAGGNGIGHRELRAVSGERLDMFQDLGHDEDGAFGPSSSPARHGTSAAGAERASRTASAAGTAVASAPPATPKQVQTITRMARAAGRTIEAEGLSRAQASELISSLIGEMDQQRAS